MRRPKIGVSFRNLLKSIGLSSGNENPAGKEEVFLEHRWDIRKSKNSTE